MLRVSQEILRRKDGDKSRMQQSTSRATRGVEENKTRLKRRQVCNEQRDWKCRAKQGKV